MTARDALDGMKARLEAATPGPWKTVRHDLSLYVEAESGELNPINLGYVGNRPERDAAFIAAAPTDVARLIGAVEAVLARLDEWDSYKAWPDAEETQVWYSAGKRHASEAVRTLITEALEEPQ